jgi:hypothetical protein
MPSRLEKARERALGTIHAQQQEIEEMAQRASACNDRVDQTLLSDARTRLAGIAEKARSPETSVVELAELERDACYQSQLSAYLCPQREIADEGSLCPGGHANSPTRGEVKLLHLICS